ncbi:MAG: hypothetical protein KBE22_10755 [Candidatus Accumulibacter sp.]|uniref:Uncharacterized protein n=1 Tax=Candidatus Accumulibacter affinis TaxID=2954384 RepID=A0A935TAL5_9PROT|nr:hypothetical protein [Candidatus Accumulibacter affinis]MBP9805366.1 hypothetical protein [Accumulibacter sp.]
MAFIIGGVWNRHDRYWHSNVVVQLLALQFFGLTCTAALPDLAHCSVASA